MSHIVEETGMLEKEVGAALCQLGIKLCRDAVDIAADGKFYVILLPIQRGILVDAELLMEEAVGGLNTFVGDHSCNLLIISGCKDSESG